jgi:hypothetical protein
MPAPEFNELEPEAVTMGVCVVAVVVAVVRISAY